MSSPTSIDAREALRLGVAPVLVAAYAIETGFPLPFFPPVLTATILAVSVTRPPLHMLVVLFCAMSGVTAVLAALFAAIANQPLPFWMVVLAASAIAFRRLARNPADMPGSMALVMIAMSTVVLQLSIMPPDELVSTVARALLIAIAASLIAHALLPSAPRAAAAARPAPAPRPGDGIRVLCRALGLAGILLLMLNVEEKNALLVAVTVGPVLALNDRHAAWTYGRRALLANLLAFLVAMPPLLLLLMRPDGLLACLLATATGILLAVRAIVGGPASAASVAMPLYGVVLALFAGTAAMGGDVLGAKVLTRLGAIAAGIAFGIAVQALLPAPRGAAATASAAR